MLQVKEKTKCCGCTACYSVCPKQCISMKPDEEGFLYPVVDEESCVQCGLCEKVCPFYSKSAEPKKETVFAAVQHTDFEKRKTSTAGGAFTLIADEILRRKGTVYAVGYDENMVVCHKKCLEKEEQQKLRGSKYVQSDLKDTFREIKDLLKQEQQVLFVGTPCQVHGLKNVIGDHKNLYTIDLLCLGVSSPKLFAEWLEYLKEKYSSSVVDVQFRNKHYGYATPNVRVFFENGREMDQKYDSKVHANLFFRHYNVRPSCYECEFREVPRKSDFTIGDFTEIGTFCKSMDDDWGTTKLWIHTPKGKELLDAVKQQMQLLVVEELSTNIVGGPKKQIQIPEKRTEFFKDAEKLPYKELIAKWEPKKFKGELVGVLRQVLNHVPGKKLLFQYLREQKLKKHAKRVSEINR